MPQIEIRYGDELDTGSLLRVHRGSILELGLTAYTKDECHSWAFGLTPQGYFDAMTSGGETYFVAEANGEVVGFCTFKDNEIMGLYVDPTASRNGLGSLLLEKAERQISSESHRSSKLTAALSAVPFYQRHNYSIHDRRFWKTRGGLEIEVCEMAKDVVGP